MFLKNSLLYYITICLCLLVSIQVKAQPFSYVYIQGDRETPMYVKLEDQMQPRYGKNYCILSQLAPGEIHIQVLFQQNIFPPQRFTIMVPENGYRGFLLTHKGNTFSLYDIQQHFYLPAGNSAVDDHAPVNKQENNYLTTANKQAQPPDSEQPVAADEKPAHIEKSNKTSHANNQPQFIDIELNNERSVQAGSTRPVGADDLANNISANKAPILNSDCPNPVGADEFNDLYKKATQRTNKTRLKYLLGRLDNCYSTAQVRELTKTLVNDPERYAFLKQAYSRITDQEQFPALEGLLSTQEWKSYFRLIIP